MLFTFRVPEGGHALELVEALRAARPGDAVDLNFIYAFQAATQEPSAAPGPVRPPTAGARPAGVGSER